MSFPGYYPPTNEDIAALLGGYIPRYQTSSTPIPPLPAGATSLSEQSAPGASQGIDARGWAASDRIEKAATEASTFADLQPPTHLSSRNLMIPPDPPHGARTAGADYYGTEAGFSFRQHPTQLPPAFHSYLPHVGGNLTEHTYPLYDNPVTHHGQTGGYPQSSGATLNLDEFSGAMPPRSSDLDRPYTPYTAAGGHCPPSDNTTWGSPTVVRETSPSSGVVDPSVSGRPEGIGDNETAGKPKGSPPLGTSNVKSRNPKKRKRSDAQETPRKVTEYGRHSRPQHHDPQRRSIQPPPPFLPRPFDLHIARQVEYKCGITQKWTKLPDIVFTVEGVVGIRLTEAMNIYFNGPDDRDQQMFAGPGFGSSFSCRIWFEEHPASQEARPVSTWNYKKDKARITKKKLAEYTAKRIDTYLKELREAGTPYYIRFEDMVLTRLVHVSKASFQPEIQYQIAPSSSISA